MFVGGSGSRYGIGRWLVDRQRTVSSSIRSMHRPWIRRAFVHEAASPSSFADLSLKRPGVSSTASAAATTTAAARNGSSRSVPGTDEERECWLASAPPDFRLLVAPAEGEGITDQMLLYERTVEQMMQVHDTAASSSSPSSSSMTSVGAVENGGESLVSPQAI